MIFRQPIIESKVAEVKMCIVPHADRELNNSGYVTYIDNEVGSIYHYLVVLESLRCHPVIGTRPALCPDLHIQFSLFVPSAPV